ncbi:MAG: TetR/AcrR family transcriptional regulator [Thermomicrobiales bacterium]
MDDAPYRRDRPAMTGVRAHIADAAIRVIARDGFDVVSIRTVAKEAGIVHGTVQYWFPSRDALLAGALLRFAQRQEQRVAQVLTNLPPDAAPAVRMVQALRELLPIDPIRREEAALWVAMSSAASTRPSLTTPYLAELAVLRDAIRAALDRGIASGRIDLRTTSEQGAYLLSALINGLMIDGLNAPEGDLPRLEESLAIGVRIVLGVAPPA